MIHVQYKYYTIHVHVHTCTCTCMNTKQPLYLMFMNRISKSAPFWFTSITKTSLIGSTTCINKHKI